MYSVVIISLMASADTLAVCLTSNYLTVCLERGPGDRIWCLCRFIFLLWGRSAYLYSSEGLVSLNINDYQNYITLLPSSTRSRLSIRRREPAWRAFSTEIAAPLRKLPNVRFRLWGVGCRRKNQRSTHILSWACSWRFTEKDGSDTPMLWIFP